MKKLSLLFAMLTMVVSGAWADVSAGYYRIRGTESSYTSRYMYQNDNQVFAGTNGVSNVTGIIKLEKVDDAATNTFYLKGNDGRYIQDRTGMTSTNDIYTFNTTPISYNIISYTRSGEGTEGYYLQQTNIVSCGITNNDHRCLCFNDNTDNSGVHTWGAWTAGSNWQIEAVTGMDFYTINLTGATTVSYTTEGYTGTTTIYNGGFVAVTAGTELNASDFSVATVEGQKKTITIDTDNKTVTITVSTIMPVAGNWYRFKSGSGNGKYLCSTLSGTQMTQSATKDATTLFYYSDGKLKAATGGYVSDNGIAETGTDVTFVESVKGTAGKVNIKSGTSTDNFLFGNWDGSAITMSSESSAKQWAGYDWIVEPVIVETRSTAANAYGTICLPYDATATGAVVMEFTGRSTKGLVFTPVENTTLSAGVPYLYRATANEPTFTTTTSTWTDASNVNGFTGVYAAQDVPSDKYFLYTEDNCFHPAGSYVHINAYKCYFDTLPDVDGSLARENAVVFGIFGDQATGIQSINTSVNLNKDGKFINNGRVVIVKNGKKFNTAGQTIK